MFFLSGTLALSDGSILTGAAIKDGGLATIPRAGHEIRYVGDDIHLANVGLADIATAQDLVARLYHDSVAFQLYFGAVQSSLVAVNPVGDVASVQFQFGAHLASGVHLYIAGSSHDEAPVWRTNDMAAVGTLFSNDVDFMALFSGIIV